jgi:acetyl esterase/lipase
MLCRLALFVLASSVLAGCTRAYFGTLNAGDVEVPSHSVAYLPEQRIALDVYRARGSGPSPLLVFLYGGRWQGGRRADYAFVGEALAEAGITTLIADYRLYPQVRFPAFVEDAAAAVAWAHRHAGSLGADPRRLFLAGHSAGAHIAALVGTDARYLAAHGLQPRDLAGVIGIAGPYDFLPLREDDLIDIFGADAASQHASQPVHFVDGDEPPFLLLHGRSDLLVWHANSERLKARLDVAGVPASLKSYAGVGHVRILASLRYPALAPTRNDLQSFVAAAGATAAMPTAHDGQASTRAAAE